MKLIEIHREDIEALPALLGGHVDIAGTTAGPVQAHIKAGTLRPLAVFGDARMKAFPEVPTLRELGFNVASPVVYGLLAPKGTPQAIVTRINTEWAKISKDPEVIEAYARLGVNTEQSTPAKVFEMARAEYPVMGKILKEAGVQPE
mgnify:CR=1 FL=1